MSTNEIPKADGSKPAHAGRIVAIATTVLWILAFVLPFMLPPNSILKWLPDTLLLVGFWPLLYLWRPGWPSLVFGVINIIIGSILFIGHFLPADAFPKGAESMLAVRKHIDEQHEPLAWVLVGVVSFGFGIVRMAQNAVHKRRAGKV